MIIAITGKPGGGKTYETVKNYIIPCLLEGRRVVTNIPLQLEHFTAVYGERVKDLIIVVEYDFHSYGNERPFSTPADYEKYQDWTNDKGQSVYFFIDECHLSLPSGRAQSPVLEYFSMHRHAGVDIALITQNMRKVHKDIRDMVTLEYRCIKKAMLGKDDEYIVKVHDGVGGHVNTQYERAYEKHIFPFYKSHTKANSAVLESTSKQTNNISKKWSYASYGVILFAIMIFISAFTSDEEEVATTAAVAKPVSEVEQVQEPSVSNLAEEPKVKTKPMATSKKSINQMLMERDMRRSKDYHPYYKVQLHIESSSMYWDRAQNVVVKHISISGSRNGQVMFSFDYSDLIRAGYEVEVLGDCNMKIRYFDYEDFLVCDRPTQEIVGL